MQREIQLSPGLVYRDGNRVGQVQATAVRPHRQAKAPLIGQGVADVRRQAAAFGAEQERIAALEPNLVKRLRTFGGKGEQARVVKAFKAAVKIGVSLEWRVLVIIQTGTAQPLVIQFEAQWLDQVQATTGIGAEPDNVAGIRRNFRLKKDYVKHARHRL